MPATQSERGAAASDIFSRLCNDGQHGMRARAMEHLADACLHWARFPIKSDSRFNSKSKGGGFVIPEEVPLLKVKDPGVPVMTFHTPLDPSMQYKDCIWINRYETTFVTAGGVNLPKITACLGSDGVKYKQLVRPSVRVQVACQLSFSSRVKVEMTCDRTQSCSKCLNL